MKYTQLSRIIKGPLFTRQDLRQRGWPVFGYQLTLWQKQGYIIKIKNGVYLFEDRLNEVVPEALAGTIYSPSYISLEKALSIYGFIPEIVYGITSVTSRTTRTFKNRVGEYTYRHLKPSLFFGYRETAGYLLAEPEKALLDFLYFNRGRIKSREDLDDYRFNRQRILKGVSGKKLSHYLARFKDEKMQKIVKWIAGEY